MRLGIASVAAGALALLAGACSLVASLGDDYTTVDGGESPDGSMTSGEEAGAEGGGKGDAAGGDGGGPIVDGAADADAQGSSCTVDPTFANGLAPSLGTDGSAELFYLTQLADQSFLAQLQAKGGTLFASLSAMGEGGIISAAPDLPSGLVSQGTQAAGLVIRSGADPSTLLSVAQDGGVQTLGTVAEALQGSTLAVTGGGTYLVGITQLPSFGIAAFLPSGGPDPTFGADGMALVSDCAGTNAGPFVAAIDGGRIVAASCVNGTPPNQVQSLEYYVFGNTYPSGVTYPAVTAATSAFHIAFAAGRPGGAVAYLVSDDDVDVVTSVTAINAQGALSPAFNDAGTLTLSSVTNTAAGTVDSQDRLLLASPVSDAGSWAIQVNRVTPDGRLDSWSRSYPVPGGTTPLIQAVVAASDGRVIVGYNAGDPSSSTPALVAFCP
jgi:hypothetical protein